MLDIHSRILLLDGDTDMGIVLPWPIQVIFVWSKICFYIPTDHPRALRIFEFALNCFLQ